MSIVAYLFYLLTAFSLYMWHKVGTAMFIDTIVPWLIFIIVIIAPLAWLLHREEKRK